MQYEQRYVAYLDILGYKDKLRENREPDKAKQQIGCLKEAIGRARSDHSRDCKRGHYPDTTMRIVSDAVLISAPLDDDGCFDVILLTTTLTSCLAYRDLWVRGGVTYGWHYDDGEVLFSPAMLTALQMEQEEAFYPRVLVDDEVVKACARVGGADTRDDDFWPTRRDTLEKSLWQDQDSRYFLNYLHLVIPERLRTDEFEQNFMIRHRDNIAANLKRYACLPRLAAKHGWLASYHNRFCREVLAEDEGEKYAVPIGVDTDED